MKRLNLAIATVATLALIGCGGGGGSSSVEDTTGGTTTGGTTTGGTTTGGSTTGGSTNGGSKTTVNTTDSIGELKPYLSLAIKLVTGTQKISCLAAENGKGKTISQWISGSTVRFDYTEYDNTQCVGDYTKMKLSYYSLTLGNEINGGKALEVSLKFDHGDDIVDKMPNHMLGYDIANTFYTTIVASGNESKQEIKMGMAKPTDTNDGTSASKRANDVSDYTSGEYYFSN
jgi:hypothetical protein